MAKVLLKKSSVASNAPGTGEVDYGEVAINYADGRLYYKNSSNVIKNFIDSDLIATKIAAAAARSFATFEYLADSGQTNFFNSDENGSILSYNPDNIIVSLNGVILRPGEDYTASNGTSIALDSAVSLNDVLQITSFDFFNIADTVRASTGGTFSGPITATAFVGPLTGAASSNVLKAGDTMTGQLISTLANNTTAGGGQLYLNGATGNRIDFNTNGVAGPSYTTRSAGTKLLLYPALSGVQVDYAMGISPATMWSSVPVNDSSFSFKWYGGDIEVASITGTGIITATSFTGSASGLTGISSTNLASAQSLIIYNSTGTALKTLYGAGS